MAHTRINFLSVPVDIIPEQNLAQEITEISQNMSSSQISFVTMCDILKARMKQDYMNCLKSAALVIPISKSILTGASFLKLQVPVRYNPFKAVISIMNALDNADASDFDLEVLENWLKNPKDMVQVICDRIINRNCSDYNETICAYIGQGIED